MKFKAFLLESYLKPTLLSIVNSILISLKTANKEKREQIQQNVDARVAKNTATRKVFRTVRENFNQLQVVCRDVAGKNKNSALYQISSLPTTAFSYDSDEPSISNSETRKTALVLLVDALNDIGEQKLSVELKREIDELMTTPKKQSSSKESYKDAESVESIKNLNKQRQQVEALINQVISELPKHQQPEARRVIAKSDNKLATLDNFLNNL